MKLRTLNITWHPWRRWFESSTAPEIILTRPELKTNHNVTPREIREARRTRRVP